MATLCRNCSHALVFDPRSQMMNCSFCGSSFKPEEVQSEAKEYREDLQPEDAAVVYNFPEEKFMEQELAERFKGPLASNED